MLGLGTALIVVGQACAGGASPGQKSPDFSLTDTQGTKRSLSDYKGKYVILEWTNPDCPFVRKHYDSGNMQRLQREMTSKGIVWLSICSSAPGKQGNYSPAEWKELIQKRNIASTAVLLDPDGKVGHAYGAKTTPHMYLVGPEGNLLYQGAIDDKPTPHLEDVKTAKNYVREVVAEAMMGRRVTTSKTEPYGCSVKYK